MKSLLYLFRRGHGVVTILSLFIASGLMGQSKIKIQIVDSVSNKGSCNNFISFYSLRLNGAVEN